MRLGETHHTLGMRSAEWEAPCFFRHASVGVKGVKNAYLRKMPALLLFAAQEWVLARTAEVKGTVPFF